MDPTIQTFFDPATFTATYVVSDPTTRTAAVIDPVLDFEPKGGRLSTTSADAIIAAAHAQGLTLAYVLETHAHADHLSAADHIRRRTGAKVAIGAQIVQTQALFAALFEAEAIAPDGGDFDILLREGDQLPLGELTVRILHTPGHTPGCVTFLIGNSAFVGDTLFMPDYGVARADFPGGDAATLFRSIRKILALPATARIFVGHDYLPPGRTEFRWESTVAEQRAHNVQVRDGIDEDAFVTARKARDAALPPPTLLLPALQVNIRAGALPPPSASGRVFLKIPVTMV
jgi:glyoxylase-like metal-dependent hydrolase (beta-lactamase superfamily II)